MNVPRRFGMMLFAIVCLSLPLFPAAADCTTTDPDSNQTWECLGIDADGVNVATGDDTVWVIGSVNGLNGIRSGGEGSTLRVYVVGPDGEIVASDTAIYMQGSGDIFVEIDEGQTVYGESYGIYIDGSGNVTSIGNVTGGASGIAVQGHGNVTSSGNVTGGDYGIYIYGNGNVTSIGTVEGTTDYGIRINGHGDVTSIGDVIGKYQGIHLGSGNVTSVGNITSTQYGIYINGAGNVTSVGNIQGTSVAGIVVVGDGEIDVRGSVTGNTGILGGTGDQIIVIDAVVTGTGGTAINTEGGNDAIYLEGDAVHIQGDIRMGSGDDTLRIGSGARVDGLIDAGSGYETNGDLLIVGNETLCKEESGALGRYSENSALVESLNLAGDTFTFDGQTYDIENFERAGNGIRRRTCYPRIEDGRTNAYDIGAWVALYCNTLDGVNLWAIDLEGNGQVDISVDGATMKAALQQAVDTGSDMLVAAGPRGTTLWALSWNQYRVVRPDQREPDKNYEYTFAPGTCGIGNRLDG